MTQALYLGTFGNPYFGSKMSNSNADSPIIFCRWEQHYLEQALKLVENKVFALESVAVPPNVRGAKSFIYFGAILKLSVFVLSGITFFQIWLLRRRGHRDFRTVDVELDPKNVGKHCTLPESTHIQTLRF